MLKQSLGALACAGLVSGATLGQDFSDSTSVNASVSIEALRNVAVTAERDMAFGAFDYILDNLTEDGRYGWLPSDLTLQKSGQVYTCVSNAPRATGATIRTAGVASSGFVTSEGEPNRTAQISLTSANRSTDSSLRLESEGTDSTSLEVSSLGYVLLDGSASLLTNELPFGPAQPTRFDEDGKLALCLFGQIELPNEDETTNISGQIFSASLNVRVSYD